MATPRTICEEGHEVGVAHCRSSECDAVHEGCSKLLVQGRPQFLVHFAHVGVGGLESCTSYRKCLDCTQGRNRTTERVAREDQILLASDGILVDRGHWDRATSCEEPAVHFRTRFRKDRLEYATIGGPVLDRRAATTAHHYVVLILDDHAPLLPRQIVLHKSRSKPDRPKQTEGGRKRAHHALCVVPSITARYLGC